MHVADTDPTGRHALAGGAARPGAGPAVRTAGQARAAVRAALGRHAENARLVGDACLAATELVTNAVRHAGGVTGFDARLREDGTVLTIEVDDADDRHPCGDDSSLRDPTRVGGRGWLLVQLLADSWEIRSLVGGGKRIRITFDA
ncbi:ATP-binding protein [Kitasatospora sp. NPDC004531]